MTRRKLQVGLWPTRRSLNPSRNTLVSFRFSIYSVSCRGLMRSWPMSTRCIIRSGRREKDINCSVVSVEEKPTSKWHSPSSVYLSSLSIFRNGNQLRPEKEEKTTCPKGITLCTKIFSTLIFLTKSSWLDHWGKLDIAATLICGSKLVKQIGPSNLFVAAKFQRSQYSSTVAQIFIPNIPSIRG